jgi:phospholipase/carboxylesterase
MSFLEAFAEDLPARVPPRPARNTAMSTRVACSWPPRLAGRLLAWGMRRPAVELVTAPVVPGEGRALALVAGAPLGPPEALLVGRQFAHFLADGTVRLRLPAPALEPVLERGWGVRERLEGEPVPGNTVRLHAPRDEEELHAVALILDVARAYASGEFS